MPDVAAARTRLEASLAELEGRLKNLATDLYEPPAADWDELNRSIARILEDSQS